jgi:hypothetical protein
MEIADFFEVNVATIYRWKNENAAFCEALKVGKDIADERVVRSLYNRAVGYTFDSEKLITVSGGKDTGSIVERHAIKEHVPPDTTAQIFWLKNRRRHEWRDKQDHELSGPDGGPIKTEHDLASSTAFLLKKGLKVG